MKILLFASLFSLSFSILSFAQGKESVDQESNPKNLTVKIVTKNCTDIDWDAYQQKLSAMKEVGGKKFIIELQHDGTSDRGLPTKTEVTLTGRNPEKVIRRAKRWCQRIS